MIFSGSSGIIERKDLGVQCSLRIRIRSNRHLPDPHPAPADPDPYPFQPNVKQTKISFRKFKYAVQNIEHYDTYEADEEDKH